MSILSDQANSRLNKLLNKEAYVPPAPQGGGAPMPMDPAAAGGGAPMPPPQGASMPPPQGAPMPPPQGGGNGAPVPVDPAAVMGGGQGAPADPTTGADPTMAMGDTPMPVMLDMNDLKAILEEAATGNNKIDRLEKMVEMIAKRMGIDIKSEEDTAENAAESEEGMPSYLKVPEKQTSNESAPAPQGPPATVSPQDQQGLEGVVNMLQGA